MTAPLPSGAVTALQGALAAEHAAVWGYGVAGARLTGAELTMARAREAAHRARRDAVAETLHAGGVDPVAAAPAYRLPFPVTGRASALSLAVRLEDGVARAWLPVVGASTDRAARASALAALSDAAVAAARWRLLAAPGTPPTVAFPGR